MTSLVSRPGIAERRGSLWSYLVHPSSLPLTRFHQFALDRLQIDLGIAQGRLQIFVSQEFTHRWQADPAAELDGRVGVAQPVDRDGFLLIGKMLGACGACLLHVPLEVIPDGAVIESLAISSAFTHITTEEGTNSAHRFEQFPEQRDAVTGIDQGDHPFLVPLAHNPQVATIKVVEIHVLYLQAQRLPYAHARFVQQCEQQTVAQLWAGDSDQNRFDLFFSQRTRVTLADGD